VDELYVIARRVLLDALDALREHRDATILVGAQAIYLHAGDAGLGVAEYTTDADLALDPDLLAEIPPPLFGSRGGEGAAMAARATQPVMDADQVRVTCEALAGDLLDVLKS
jgi:hypothetical protein